MARRKLSILVPVLNEAENIHPFYERTCAVLAGLEDRYDWEFVFTDNCSADETFNVLTRMADRDPRVRVFRFSRNFGFQNSILTGLLQCQGDAAIQLDCDLQDPPEMIVDFVRLWEAGYKVVYGVRRARAESALLRGARRLFYRLIDVLSEDHLPRDAGDFRLIDRVVIDLCGQFAGRQPYIRGTIAQLGFRQIGIVYDRAAREHGESKFSIGQYFSLAIDGITSHSILPLRVASLFGLVLFLISIAGGLFYLLHYFLSDTSEWPRGFISLALLMLISLAANAIFLGILGEYVARIFVHVKPRPTAIIEMSLNDRIPPGTPVVAGSSGPVLVGAPPERKVVQ
jgi:glycosyltransferase involved in cell wall biosynthesis